MDSRFVVGCVQKLTISDIKSGIYAHLEIFWTESGVTYRDQVLPTVEAGIYSKRNQKGYEIVHKNRPKTTRTWSIDVPNYGDWEKGHHDIQFSRPVYQRDVFGPKLLTISVEHIGEDIRDGAQIFKFTVDDILNRDDESFYDQLLFDLNLLQENVGNHDVFGADAEADAFLKTLYVNWELFPPGNKENILAMILGTTETEGSRVHRVISERYDFLQSLKPTNFIRGVNEFRRYFGAQFAEDLVVFENVDYGNALYVMYEDWTELSRLPRTKLLSSSTHQFDRIVHSRTWKIRLRKLVRQEMEKRNLNS